MESTETENIFRSEDGDLVHPAKPSGPTATARSGMMFDLCERLVCERFSYDLEIKTHEQNRNKKRREIKRFDWFVERIQTSVAFGWLSERSAEKTSCPRTF